MAYEIISQNNNTTTLSDGTNTITVPSRVVLATGTTYEITEVNNSTATLEGSDGSVIRDVPCVAVLAGGGSSGSSLPDQTGHSGEFLTTDGTDASWAAVDALPSQTGNSGKFLTTNGTTASWGNALTNRSSASGSLAIIGSAPQTQAIAIGVSAYADTEATAIGWTSSAAGRESVAIGWKASANSNYSTAVGEEASASGQSSVALGVTAQAEAQNAIQIGTGSNSTANTLNVGLGYVNGSQVNVRLLSNDGTIPTDRYTTTPSADGTYVPTLTISSGVATRSWGSGGGSSLPSQTGNSGKFLTTDGTDASWSDKPLVNNNPRTTTSIMIGNIGSSVASIGYGSVCITSNNTYSGWVGLGGDSVAIGTQSCGGSNSIAIGNASSCSHQYSTVIGYSATSDGTTGTNHNIALGAYAKAGGAGVTTVHAIQIGSTGSQTANSDSNTMKVANANGNFEMMSADGTIPAARHAALPAADGTYVLKLVIASGVPTLSWVAE